MICNHMSVEKALAELPWKEQAGWQKSTPGAWLVDRQPAGNSKIEESIALYCWCLVSCGVVH